MLKIIRFVLGGFYCILGNIYPKYRSSLKLTLNLVILSPVKWIKKYGMNDVLKPLMADIEISSWLVRLYDFYSRVVKDR